MIDYIDINNSQSAIRVRFDNHVKVSTLVNDNFKLFLDSATPSEIPSAFREIVCDDYDSIRRILTLYLNVGLDEYTDYELHTSGVEYAGTGVAPNDEMDFTTTIAIAPAIPDLPDSISVEDHSIINTSTITVEDITNTSTGISEFYVAQTTPEHNDYFIEQDHEDGKMTIVFSANPDVAHINSEYIKVQRKKNQIAPIRWETIPVQFSISSNKPWVYLSFPAIEDNTIYREPGYTYFEEGYVYRVKLSKYIQAA